MRKKRLLRIVCVLFPYGSPSWFWVVAERLKSLPDLNQTFRARAFRDRLYRIRNANPMRPSAIYPVLFRPRYLRIRVRG
jgi:hypothetical protein